MRNAFPPALGPSDLSRKGVVVVADKQNLSQCWVPLLTAPAALCNCGPVRVGCGLRQQQQPLQLTAYTSAHSTAPGSTCSMEAGVEEEGTTCSVVQPHLQRPVDGQRMCPPGNTRGCGLMSARARG